MAYVTSGLLLYLDAKDYPSGSTSTTWADKSGNGNNFTLYNFGFNGTTSGWTGGIALATDGTDDTAYNSTALAIKSIEVYFTALSQNQVILNNTDGYGISMQIVNNSLVLDTNGAKISTSITLTPGTDYHIVMQLEATSTCKVYINGAYSTQAIDSNIKFTNSKLFLGSGWGASYFGLSKIKSVRAYNRVLTTAEVTQNYNDIINPTTAATNNLLGSIASTSSLSASLSVAKALSGSVVSTSTVSASLKVTKPLSGSIASASAVNGTVSITKPLSGTVVSISSVFGDLSVIGGISLSSTVSVVSSVSGTLSKGVNLIGIITSKTSVIGSITVIDPNMVNIIVASLDITVKDSFSADSKIINNYDIDAACSDRFDLDTSCTTIFNMEVVM